MPRLSLWKSEKSNDYRFFDRTIKEMYTVGATDLYIHKYIGTNNPNTSVDATLPFYDKTDPTNIQDLLFLENRDRKYDDNIYRLRGHYNVQNLDFDLSQFGLFLTNDVIFITVHYNDMIDIIGRKLMVGDVFELPHLTDYHPLNETIPIGLRRYYQITDANFASEGFSQSWYPHLWRIKCEPLVDSQEFSSILNKPINTDNYLGTWDKSKSYPEGYTISYGDTVYKAITDVPIGISPPNTQYWEKRPDDTLIDILSRYKENLDINNANLAEASRLVPKSGYDVSQLYVLPTLDDSIPGNPVDIVFNTSIVKPKTYIDIVNNPEYKNSSPVIRISKESLNNQIFLTLGTRVTLKISEISPKLTEGGSGPMVNDLGISVSIQTTENILGTSDNTYITSDQSINLLLTAYSTPPRVNTIRLVDIPETLKTGLKIKGVVFSEFGLPEYVFDDNTTITSIDHIEKTIQLSNPTNTSIPEGHPLEVSYDFEGVINDDNNYLADFDPKFQFIKRFTPRNFGYLVGYMSGDGSAPNGEPVRSGTAFPTNPVLGEYFLRLDYLPQRLFRWDGKIWVSISSKVRTEPGITKADESLISGFINNDSTIKNVLGEEVSARQGLSKALKIKPD